MGISFSFQILRPLTWLAVVTALFASAARAKDQPQPLLDPHLWMEEVASPDALAWVQNNNTRTASTLQADPKFTSIFSDLTNIYLSADRVDFASFSGGYFWNFLQDGEHPQGVLRRTTYEEYKKPNPDWEAILDVDALSRAENEKWVYQGSTRLDRNSARSMISLSRGGKDAVVLREFDFAEHAFVKDGFIVPEAKTYLTPVDQDHLLVASDFGPDSLTESGYPRTVRLWTRGQPLAQAPIVFVVNGKDMAASSLRFCDDDGTKYTLFARWADFHNRDYYLQMPNGTLRRLPLPSTASLLAVRKGIIYFQLKTELTVGEKIFAANAILEIDLQAQTLDDVELIFQASQTQSVEGFALAADRILVTVLENVHSEVFELIYHERAWHRRRLPLPMGGTIEYEQKASEKDDPTSFTTMTYTNHLTPYTKYRVHDEDGSYELEVLKQSPVSFDAKAIDVVQNFAISKDGTRVPYFLLKNKNTVLNGRNPTLLYGYGGFEVSLSPTYSADVGKAWLERGGVYALANIRGGGEYGSLWHQAALKSNRQRAFDDFFAVSEDLISRNVTSSAHLGILGESNGGLLIGVALTQRPDLYKAAVLQVPLLDMLRYSKLLAGASWVGEYGDPDDIDECKYLLSYSPYHNLRPDVHYPTPFFITSTKDDRVSPAHARKMAARMESMGLPFYYYENLNGGHAGSSDPDEQTFITALKYAYFWRMLR